MYTVKIAIKHHKPILQDYSYAVPPLLAAEPLLGKRILVDFAGRKMEAYVISEQEEEGQFKPILQVLDHQPVFDHELLELAEWMSEYWSCSLATALQLMLPPLLKKHRQDFFMAGISREELRRKNLILPPDTIAILEELWDRETMPAAELLEQMDRETAQELIAQGWLMSGGYYRARPRLEQTTIYRVAAWPDEAVWTALCRRAPRQAELLEVLRSGPAKLSDLQHSFSISSIHSLEAKGYIISEEANDDKNLPPLMHELSQEQEAALAAISAALECDRHQELLLIGVTGSGKSEVFIRSARQAIAAGYGVIVLLPEIALTRQAVDMFARQLGESAAVLHSAMTDSERSEAWQRIKNGELKLVIGARSAIFAPVRDLKLIILDEEQENSYKQEEHPRYHAREVARHRAEMNDAILLLGSATPSLESAYRAFSDKSKLLVMKQRIRQRDLPDIIIDDLRQYHHQGNKSISPGLAQALQQTWEQNGQSILFINRRGYSPQLLCRACGHIEHCSACSVAMNYHRDLDTMLCHYCGQHQDLPQHCSQCGSSYLQLLGGGTQRVEEEIREILPESHIARLDLDSSRRKGEQERILQNMRSGATDILVGTQMVAKGLNFPNVSLVGIINIDNVLNLPDFRAGERAYQLMVQAAGRAGRGEKPGRVLIQTWQPEHPIIALACEQDYFKFYTQEISRRRQLNYPPFCHLLRLVFSGTDETALQLAGAAAMERINELTDASEQELSLLGPAPCAIRKMKDRYRTQILLKCNNVQFLQSVAAALLRNQREVDCRLEADLNPVMLM